MSVARHILERPAQFQWDADSAPCQGTNCRPTALAMIAGYYLDRHISPREMRKAMQGGSEVCGGTNNAEGAAGLEKYGIPAGYGWKTPAAVIALVEANIPVDIAMNMGLIPDHPMYQTDFKFDGMHSVVACKRVIQADHTGKIVPGLLVRDPDHASPSRPERPPYNFWPDWAWKRAFVSSSSDKTRGLTVYPKAAKVMPPAAVDPKPYVKTVEVTATFLNIREKPTGLSRDVGDLKKGQRVKTTHLHENGGSYTAFGKANNDWLGFTKNGKTVWIARGYTKIVG